MDIKFSPTKLKGKVTVPPSKSIAHRAIICASLAEGKSVISNLAYSDDIRATLGCMRSLGAQIIEKDSCAEIIGCSTIGKSDVTFDCNESGSTLRFVLPVALMITRGKNKFVGRGKLGERPMDIYRDICLDQGVYYCDKSSNNKNHYLDLETQGEIKGGTFVIDGGVSSQFITGLLFALPLAEQDSEIVIKGTLQSVGYVDLTLSVLADFGISVENYDYGKFVIKGKQKYSARNYAVEGDYSQAAFYEVANYLGSDIVGIGLREDSLQGDKIIKVFLDKLKNACSNETLVFDGSDCPDIIPEFALACCLREGSTKIVNVSRLRIKECDRLAATVCELKKLGADIREDGDGMAINGVGRLKGGEVSSHKDHRMAMTLAVASTAADGEIVLIDAECVSKSYPNFYEHFVSLGGKIQIL